MSAAWRTVRVFISSTFRDMHAERDLSGQGRFSRVAGKAGKIPHPPRRHRPPLGHHGEEAQHDRVLDLCLQQIDESRPFFLGILGERYGWVPNTFSDEVAAKYGWVQHQTGKSVTELEILYGILRNPKMHGHGMLFFRDPAFIAHLPKAKRADFLAENEESARKLAALKQAIRETALPCPPYENYPCRYDGLRVDARLASRELQDQAEHEATNTVAEARIVTPEKHRQLNEHAQRLVDHFGVVHLTGLEEFGRRVSKQLWEAIRTEHDLSETPPAVTLAETDPLAEEADYHRAVHGVAAAGVCRPPRDPRALDRVCRRRGARAMSGDRLFGLGQSAVLARFART